MKRKHDEAPAAITRMVTITSSIREDYVRIKTARKHKTDRTPCGTNLND